MTDTEARLMECLRLGIDMRRAQRRYFSAAQGSDEKAKALKDSKACERAFDSAVAQIVAPSFDLGRA